MQGSQAVSRRAPLLTASAYSVAHVLEGNSIFMLALLYAVLVSPFIGGVRGWPCTLGWLVPPMLWLWRTGDRSAIGLQKPRTAKPIFVVLAACVAIGVLTGFCFFLLGFKLPLLSQFTLALPQLHRSFVGTNVKLFLVLIPVGHFVHELFYRGLLQTRLAVRLGSDTPAIVLAGLLYAWTHVFIYSSPDFQVAMASVTGARPVGIQNIETALTLVVAFSFVESAIAGFALKWTKSIFASIAYRSSNLLTVCLLVYRQHGILH